MTALAKARSGASMGKVLVGRRVVATVLIFLIAAVAFPVTVFANSSLGEAVSASSSGSRINPAWEFQSSIYGKNVSGSYPFGVVNVDYLAKFNKTGEIYTTRFS